MGFAGWLNTDYNPPDTAAAHAGATSAFLTGNVTLMSWGPIVFQVWPLNYNEMDHETGSDWAPKEIVGAAIYREWVGENDELRHLRGKVFPYRIGGHGPLQIFDAWRRAGIAQPLMSGGNFSAQNLGWFVCQKLTRNHTFIGGEGIGQQIDFEAIMARVPVVDQATYMPNIWGAFAGQGTVAPTPGPTSVPTPPTLPAGQQVA